MKSSNSKGLSAGSNQYEINESHGRLTGLILRNDGSVYTSYSYDASGDLDTMTLNYRGIDECEAV